MTKLIAAKTREPHRDATVQRSQQRLHTCLRDLRDEPAVVVQASLAEPASADAADEAIRQYYRRCNPEASEEELRLKQAADEERELCGGYW